MKIIERISLAIFTVITFIISLAFVLAFFNVIGVTDITNAIKFMLVQEPNRTVFLAISIICLLLDIIIICYDDNERKPIVTEGEKGKLCQKQ